MAKIQPGITIDSETWKAFKEKFQNNASQETERLMKMSIEAPYMENVSYISASSLGAMSIEQLTDWSATYTTNSMNLTNVNPSTDGTVLLSWTEDCKKGGK